MTQLAPAPAIELRAISKRFGAVLANDRIDLSIAPATIHGIVGENGAGKSTLMSILYGYYQADGGEIIINGQRKSIRNSEEAISVGIGMVHQHFMLVDTFTVLENVILGAEEGPLLAAALQRARDDLEQLARNYGLTVDPDALVGELAVGIRQRVEILKALFRGARILVLDEPTGVLTPQEADALFDVLRALRERGVTVILITHKLREIIAITDNVSVMRGGRLVASLPTGETDERGLAELMVGRKVAMRIDKPAVSAGEVLLRVDDLVVRDADGVARVNRVSFEVRAGEILGVAGVSGNGQTELLEALAGMRTLSEGSICLRDARADADRPFNPRQLRRLRLAHVPEDRLRLGLVGSFEAAESYLLGYHDYPQYRRGIFTRVSALYDECLDRMLDYDVRPPNPKLRTANFSGGNQQKLVLARELSRGPEVLLVGQPTRGVDIGAIEFLHNRLVDMRNAGKAIVLVSVELEEIMTLSDRILVMFDGQVSGEIAGERATELTLGLMMSSASSAPSDAAASPASPARSASKAGSGH